MTGSGENHTAYFYKRANTPPSTLSAKKAVTNVMLALPGRTAEEPDTEMFCDAAFYPTCSLAAALDNAELTKYVLAAVQEHLEGPSAPRTRTQRKIAEAV